MEEDSLYSVALKHSPNLFQNLPLCVRVMIDYGCLLAFDKDDNLTEAYSEGQWVHVIRAGTRGEDPAADDDESVGRIDGW